jgi:hypothetical protein
MNIPNLGNVPLLGQPSPSSIMREELAEGDRDDLLICKDCGTIEHIPFFDGPPEYNSARIARLRDHVYDLADGTSSTHEIAFTTVNSLFWKTSQDFRDWVVRAINDSIETGDVGLGEKNYALKSTFMEDAVTCWRKHKRTNDCDEYMSKGKRLVPDDTRGDRKELGLSTRSADMPGIYLCSFCPVHSIVAQNERAKQGLYS